MKFTIDITREDYSDFNKFHFLNTRLKRTIITSVLALIVLQLALNRPRFNLTATIVSTIVFIAICFILIYRNLNNTKNIPDKDGAILGEKEMEFSESKIIYSTKNAQGTCEWTSIKSLKESSSAFYLYMDTNMAMLVPKRVFSNTHDMDHFRNLVNQNISR